MAVENAVFDAAPQLVDPAQRRQFLDKAFHGDPEGRREMEELLEMATDASRYFHEARQGTAELAREVLAGIPGWPLDWDEEEARGRGGGIASHPYG